MLISLKSLPNHVRIWKRQFSDMKILNRYSVIPLKLFRIVGATKKVVVREKTKQFDKGSRSFDYTIGADGLIHPAPLDNTFIGPNGASFRPASINMWDFLSQRKGITYVVEVPEGSILPPELVMLHERDDHYSLQLTTPMKPTVFNKRINDYLANFEVYPKSTYFERYPLPHA